ncbi:MAG: TonB-dependent receptor [Bacteroidales bacterium]|nr:TonB-dependent receptor [Bacteroidales bacterium]
MKLLKFTLPLLLFTFILTQVNTAQDNNAMIKGYVFNPDNQPAAFSTVILLNTDSVFMKGGLSQTDGLFILEKISPGDYLIMVRNVEFETYISAPITITKNETKVLDNIKLQTKVNGLDEVVVTGTKAMVEVRPDKMVFNISSSVNATGNNGLELLSKAPGVLVDFDKNIILQGKSGVQIYINGRPSRLSGTDLTNMLEGMRSENIESIEIISNPSSKYDAEGTGGIINIVLKKNTRTGFSGNATAGYSKGNFGRSSIGTSLNYSGEKINLYSSLNASDNTWQTDFDQSTLRELYKIDMLSFAANNRKGYTASGGFDYQLNKQNIISFDAQVLINNRNNELRSITTVSDLQGIIPAEVLKANTIDDNPSNNYNFNLHYGLTPDRNSKLSVDLSAGSYSSSKDTYQPNNYYSLDSGIFLRSINNQYNANTDISLMSAVLDYETKIKSVTLSTGAKYSYISTGNNLAFYNIINDSLNYDPNLSNNFSYLEKIAAAYVILNTNLGEKVSLNAGLRVENTSSLGTLVSDIPTNDNIVPRNYTSFFPNVSMSYDDKNNNMLSISIGRRITRPNYQDLNPFESKSSELSSWKGNPFLNPNYITNYQLSYSYKRKLVISNTYSVTHDFFAMIVEAVGDKSNIIIPRNMQKVINNGLSVSYPLKVSKWWEFSTFLIYNYESYYGKLETTVIDLSANILNFRMQNTIRLPLGITSELTGYYQSPWIWRGSVNIKAYYGLNFGIKKNFFKDRLQVQVSGNDILNTNSVFYFKSNYGGQDLNGNVRFDNHRYGFNLTWQFGNQKAKVGRRNKSAIDEEMRRISD